MRLQGLQRLEYRFTGPHPIEGVRVDGRQATPAFAKTVAIPFYGRSTLFERLLWVPMGNAVALALDDAPASVRVDLHRPTLGPSPGGPTVASRVASRWIGSLVARARQVAVLRSPSLASPSAFRAGEAPRVRRARGS